MSTPCLECPPPPQAPYFDRSLSSWVLSRHRDVLAAFRESTLQQTPAPAKTSRTRSQARMDASAAVSHLKLGQMQNQMTELIHSVIGRLRPGREIDLTGELIRPWSIAFLAIMGGDGRQQRRLISIAHHISGGAADAHRSFLRSRFGSMAIVHSLPEFAWLTFRQKKAEMDLERLARKIRLPGLKSVLLGVSQTLPGFLSNAWLALLRHPEEMRRLRAEPALLPAAIEELLRYSGLVHTLVRYASTDVGIAGVDIRAGQRVVLKIASANHDPARFHEPDCLIIDRCMDHREMAQLALGAGAHSCVGAQFVRLAAITAIRAFVEKIPPISVAGAIEWSRGPILSFPRTLPAIITPR